MRFLIDADLPRSVKTLLRRYGHEGVDVRDVGLGSVPDARIARYAQDETLCLLTGDYDFSDIRTYPPARYHGLVILNVPPNATAPLILSLLEGFLKRGEVVNRIAGRLAIVEPGRVRIRPSTE
jgi:predicted nuclease of predicted toxin-antitoxin system